MATSGSDARQQTHLALFGRRTKRLPATFLLRRFAYSPNPPGITAI
jgi:hypothetical protein